MDDDRRLGDIISDGIDGHVVLIGFPYDEGVVRAGGRRGAELGPDCMRRFLPKIGPVANCEFRLSLAGMRVTDYGNIVQDSFEDAHKKLETKLTTVLCKPQKPLAVVVGGGWDQSYSVARGFFPYCEQRGLRPVIISIASAPGLMHSEIMQSGAQFRSLFELEDFRRLSCMFYSFGLQGVNCLPSDLKQISKVEGEITWLNDIRNTVVPNEERSLKTQAGACFSRLLERLAQDARNSLLLCLNLSVFNSANLPGVSSPSTSGGLTAEEGIEVAFLAGRCAQVRVLDISEFNPAVEDYRSGRLLSSMIYFFLLGVSQRPVTSVL